MPFVEETSEEKKKAQAVKNKIKKEHAEVKNDLSHIPQVEVPETLKDKKPDAKKPAVGKKTANASAKKPAAEKK